MRQNVFSVKDFYYFRCKIEMMKKVFFFIGICLPILVDAQLPSRWENDSYRLFDSYVYANDSFHTSVKPFLMNQVENIVSIDTLFKVNVQNKYLDIFLNKSIIRYHEPGFWLTIDPDINFEVGKQGNNPYSSINTRGIYVAAGLGKNWCIISTMRENQAFFNDYRQAKVDSLRVFPGQGQYKPFKTTGYDWTTATGLVSYSPSTHANFQLGNGKNSFGDGYRSLLLSDQSNAYPYFKLTIDYWKVKYVWLVGQFTDYPTKVLANTNFDKKWGAFHYLSYNTTKWFNISLFEAVMWKNQDSSGYRGLDFDYVNPVVFYRPVEYSKGSADNVLMGANLKATIHKQYILFGQLLLDDFNLPDIKANDGWWGNQYGYQIGAKAYNAAGIKHLYLHLEYNRVRPYTYEHLSNLSNYGNYGEPLANPLGANFKETIGIARYDVKRVFFDLKVIYAQYGADTKGFNAGNNVNELYDHNRLHDYGNYVGQGLLNTLKQADFSVSYLLNPMSNMNICLGVTKRMLSYGTTNNNDTYVYFAFRTSLENMKFDY